MERWMRTDGKGGSPPQEKIGLQVSIVKIMIPNPCVMPTPKMTAASAGGRAAPRRSQTSLVACCSNHVERQTQ